MKEIVPKKYLYLVWIQILRIELYHFLYQNKFYQYKFHAFNEQ